MAIIFKSALERSKNFVTQSAVFKSRGAQFAVRLFKEMGADDASHMAASVSYFALLSLFPLILGISAIVGWIADSPARQQEVVEFVADYIPGSQEFVSESVDSIVEHRGAAGLISVLGLLWSASAVFGSVTRAVNRAWKIRRKQPFYKEKPRQILMALAIAVLFLISISITSIFQWAGTIETGGRTIDDLVGGSGVSIILKLPAFIVTFLIFVAVYKFAPYTKTYWEDVWPGALVGSVLFEVAKNLFVWYLENFGNYDQLYGNIASVVVLMFWAYVSAYILIVGAEVSSLLAAQRKEREKADPAPT